MFAKTLMLASAFGASAAEPIQTKPFAVGCTGKAKFNDTIQGKPTERSYDLPRQTYVFDEGVKRVQRAMEPRQQFEDVCFRDGYINSVSFTPGLISVRAEKSGEMCDFEIDRATGKGKFMSYYDLPNGGHGSIEFQMQCEPTAVPVFDSSRNKF